MQVSGSLVCTIMLVVAAESQTTALSIVMTKEPSAGVGNA
jgi:hypothetical protein